jgi:hypothetical protein
MPTVPAVDLAELLKGIPRGAWVAIDHNEERIVAYGSDLRAVLEEAKEKGEPDPIVIRVPESTSSLML